MISELDYKHANYIFENIYVKSLTKTIDFSQVSNIQLGGINTFWTINTIKISKINKDY